MLISVITVSYNSEKTIIDTINSLQNQTLKSFESIFVDGNSSDGTLDKINQSELEQKQVYSEPDDGIYEAMNKGITHANGDVIGFLNSDDFYADKDVLKEVAFLFKDPEVDACYGDLCYVGKKNKNKVIRHWKSKPFTPGMFQKGWVPPHPTFFARREVYEKYGGFDTSYKIAADYELLLRMFEVNRINTTYIPKVLVHMRLGGETNKSIQNIIAQNQEIWKALKMYNLNPSLWSYFSSKTRNRLSQYVYK